MSINSIIEANKIQTPQGAQGDTLGKDAFLKLMLTQMQQQDPLNPMDNQAMLSQMAQFSSLEQMSNLNSTLETSSQQSQFMQSTQLLGRNVELIDPNTVGTDSPQTLTAKVKSVAFSGDGPVLTLENGMQTGIGSILRVVDPSPITN